MRAVFDTNVLVSGLLWRGAPHVLIEQVRNGRVVLVTSPALLAELAEVLDRPKFRAVLSRAATTRDTLLAGIQSLAELMDPPPLPTQVSRDLDDDAVLALAAAAQVDLIVSGDADLLVLGTYAEVVITDAAGALAKLTAARP